MPGNKYDAASGRRLMRDIIVKTKKEAPPAPPKASTVSPKMSGNLPPSSLYWSLGAVLSFTAVLFLMDYFAAAVVLVTPRQEFVEVSSDLRASAAGAADLGLEVINFNEDTTHTGAVATLKKIDEKAKGRVMIFNSFSSEPQSLVAGTRLEAPNGKIYRLQSELKVPGAKVDNGTIVPQGIETEVAADRAGEEYNLGLSDFTIPGFKSTPKFDKFYARSKTEMTGGFQGTMPVVSEEDVKKLADEAQQEFSQILQARIKSDLPEGVFVPKSAYEILTKVDAVNPPVGARGEQVTVKITGTLRGLAVKKRDIYKFLGKSYLGLELQEEMNIANFDELSLEVLSKDFNGKTLSLNVKGKAHFVWQFDEEQLKKDLLEAHENRKSVFEKYGAIERAQIDFRPFWWRIFPKDASRVKVEKILKTQ
ncbi:MAG: hypothetical protein Q8R12_04885 [bacterium]|nr:hypothetical protein [bacterium]